MGSNGVSVVDPEGNPVGERFSYRFQWGTILDWLTGADPLGEFAIARDVDPDVLVEDAQLAAQFKIGSRWTVPAGWLAEVEKVEGGRVFVTVNGMRDDYPPEMLEPMEGGS